jgi:5-(carboxyamino)imidazole ribonucleotide synthase
MINIVGPENISGPYHLQNEKELTANGDVFIHMYRKSETRPHRKLGHATVIADTLRTPAQSRSTAQSITNYCRLINPDLKQS